MSRVPREEIWTVLGESGMTRGKYGHRRGNDREPAPRERRKQPRRSAHPYASSMRRPMGLKN
jgi:hypothetical protein